MRARIFLLIFSSTSVGECVVYILRKSERARERATVYRVTRHARFNPTHILNTKFVWWSDAMPCNVMWCYVLFQCKRPTVLGNKQQKVQKKKTAQPIASTLYEVLTHLMLKPKLWIAQQYIVCAIISINIEVDVESIVIQYKFFKLCWYECYSPLNTDEIALRSQIEEVRKWLSIHSFQSSCVSNVMLQLPLTAAVVDASDLCFSVSFSFVGALLSFILLGINWIFVSTVRYRLLIRTN